MNVLVLEDNHDSGDALCRALDFRGWSFTWARNVQQAKDFYSPDQYDAMVLDFELPDGTGLDFLASIRGSDKAITILHSGLSRDKELAASGLTVDHVVSKGDPFALMDILTEVSKR